MLEMAFGTLVSRTNNLNTPFQKVIKTLIRVLLINLPISPYEGLELSKKILR
jgi:hypothetical protein